MAKGVIFGVLVCVTVLPSMILCCDKLIEKTKHKPLLPDIGRISDKVTKRKAHKAECDKSGNRRN